MMSEKRFVSFYGYAVEDKATAKKYSSDNIEELVDLINKLHDCYIKQGKMIFKLEEDLQYYKTKSARVEEELLSTSVLNECKYCLKERRNVQKFRFKNMKEVDDYLEKQINFDDDNFINSLNEENEQLKYIDNPIDDEEMTNMECLLLIIPFGILFVLLTGIVIAFLVQLGWVVI